MTSPADAWQTGLDRLTRSHFDRRLRLEELELRATVRGDAAGAAFAREQLAEHDARWQRTLDVWAGIGRAREEHRRRSARRIERALTVVAVLFGLAGACTAIGAAVRLAATFTP